MTEQNQRRWVVLIQKKPRGPLTENEINTLITQGLLLSNDLGFEWDVTTGKAKTDWRMLWQFPEFDRRAKADAERALKNLPPSPWVEKRGPAPSPEKIKAEVQAKLPEEMLEIAPEDLLPKSQSQRSYGLLDTTDIELKEQKDREIQDGKTRRYYVAWGFAILVATVVKFFWGGSASNPMPVTQLGADGDAAGERITDVTSRAKPPLGDRSFPLREANSTLSRNRSSGVPVRRDPEPLPSGEGSRAAQERDTQEDVEDERDRGEVPRDFASKKDSRWETDEVEETTDDPAFEKPKRTKNKPKKKREPLTEEDAELADEANEPDPDTPASDD